MHEAIRGAPSVPHDLVLDAEGMTHVDSAGLDALGDLSEALAHDGVTLRVARMKAPVQDRLEDAGITARIGHEHFHPTVRAAVAQHADPPRLDDDSPSTGGHRGAMTLRPC